MNWSLIALHTYFGERRPAASAIPYVTYSDDNTEWEYYSNNLLTYN